MMMPPRPAPSPASVPPSPRPAWVFFALVGGMVLLVAASALALWRREPATVAWITFGYLGYELGISALLVTAAGLGLRKMRGEGRSGVSDLKVATPRISVLIAAHNERGCIGETLDSVFAQTGVEGLEVIVASDGSTDGMVQMLSPRVGASGGRLRVLDLPRVGKGRALNAALAGARGELCVTLDADTRLGPGALAALADAFADPAVASAGGFIYVRNVLPAAGGTWITRYQFWEYVKNFIWRVGLAHLGVCLQVSGAFGAFRTGVLREELGGFSGGSLVEDYEVIFRLHERLRRAGRRYRVAVAPGAVAYTEGPETVGSFVHQRTRWFAGFLQTLWDYRRLVGDPKMGALGWFMLPVKCVDAVLPLWGFVSLGILLAAVAQGGAAGAWERAALGTFAAKWAVDVGLSLVVWRWHAKWFPDRAGMLPTGRLAWCVGTESLCFHWFRQVAVLNAYSWFFRRVQRWHQARWDAGSSKSEARSSKPVPSSKLEGEFPAVTTPPVLEL